MPVAEERLPLAHHAEHAVVEEHDGDRQPIADRRGQLVQIHAEAAVAGDEHHAVSGDGGADGRAEAVAHGAEAAAGCKPAGAVEIGELRRPHLMLPHIGGDDGFFIFDFVDDVEHALRRQYAGGLGVGSIADADAVRAERFAKLTPCGMALFLHPLIQPLEG